MPILLPAWKTSSTYMSVLMHASGLWSVWMRSLYSSSAKSVSRFLCVLVLSRKSMQNTSTMGPAVSFAIVEPLTGHQHISVRKRRTALDWAEEIQYLCDVMYPRAERIVLVMDNLNTHALGLLYKRFKPDVARRLAGRLEIHHTPKHGSWLNMAEIELNVLSRQCLNRRIESLAKLQREVRAWENKRNKKPTPIHWLFTKEKARVKLVSLYPDLSK